MGRQDSVRFVKAVSHWTDREFLMFMSPLYHPASELQLFTDVNLEGWGAHIESLMASGFWPLELKSQHINDLEMKAVWLALQAFAPHIQGHSVLLVTDSTTVSAYINRRGVGERGTRGSHSYTLCNLAVEIVLWCAKNRTHIKARHLPGRLNALADCLSRKENIVQAEWSLNQRVTSQIFHI